MSLKNPVINIITRTCDRPRSFARNVKSITSQTYTNYKHIIIADKNTTLDYINKNERMCVVQFDLNQIINSGVGCISDPGTGPHVPYNLYFNHIHDIVDPGWIMYLDDDDYLSSPTTLERIVKKVINNCDRDTLIMFKMKWMDGKTLPDDSIMRTGKKPQICGIGGSCFTYHTKFLNRVQWDNWKCGDYRFFSALYDIVPTKAWYNCVVVEAPIPGSCSRVDI